MRPLASELVHKARESPEREICGFVLKDDTIIPIRNVSEADRHFRMDPDEQVRVMQEHGSNIRAVYHSHPSGIMTPSWGDVRGNHPGFNCIIVTVAAIAEWVIADDFSSVTLAEPKTVVDDVPVLAEARRRRRHQGAASGQ